MDANKGEAERCLRESIKWQRANRPVKAMKFAKKSHSLYPTPAAQQKIGELADELQQRQANYRDPSSSILNEGSNAPSNYSQSNQSFHDFGSNLSNNRNAQNNGNASNPQQNRPYSGVRSDPPPRSAPPQNQEFVEIDPNQIQNGHNSLWTNIQSLEWWSLLLESIFGPCFESLHSLMIPIVPHCISSFRLRYRGKVWALLLTVILLAFTRFVIVQHPFFEATGSPSHSRRYHEREYEHKSHDADRSDFRGKSEYERLKEEFERKHGGSGGSSRGSNRHRESTRDRYDDYEHTYDRGNNRNRNRNRNRDRDRYDPYYGNPHGGSSYSYSGGGLTTMLSLLGIGIMFMSMFQNRGQGMNWNMMAMLPMLMGGPGIGFGFGRRGVFGRRRMFGRRGRFF